MRLARPLLALALVFVAVSGSLALAAEAPKSTATSKTLFLSQQGCGAEAGPAELLPTAQADSADGCGFLGGLPLNEVFNKNEEEFCGGPCGETYTSTKKLIAFKLDGKPIKGQVAAGSWIGAGGGVGTVTFDLKLSGVTTAGKTIQLGATTVSGSVSPTSSLVLVPFSFPAVKAATGQKFKSFAFYVNARGLNFPMSAKALSGEAYLVFPAKK